MRIAYLQIEKEEYNGKHSETETTMGQCGWVIERSFARVARFRRLARDYERLLATVAGLHVVAFAYLMLHQFIHYSLNP
jgi:DDE family transposase